MNVRTFTLLPATAQSSDFESNPVDVQRDLGYSAAVHISSATDLDMSLHIEVSADGVNYVVDTDTIVIESGDNHIVYNVGECYYNRMKLVGTIRSGSATVEINITTKSG